MYAISIDSGGTKVVGAVVDGDGNILTKKRYDIPERDGNFLIATFRDIITAVRRAVWSAMSAAPPCGATITGK